MEGFAALRSAVMEDADARAALRAAVRREDFLAAARALGERRGIPMAAGELEHRLDARRPAVHRTTFGVAAAAASEGEPLVSGVPEGFAPVAFDPAREVVQWCDLSGMELREPFFEETVDRALREPYRRLFTVCTRPLAPLDGADRLPISGLIFHTSRCGSTLVCQMLRALDGVVVCAEPPVLEHVLRAPVAAAVRTEWLGCLLAGLSRRWRADDVRTVIKLDAWATRDMDLLLAAAGHPPWAFLFREPEAVVASQLRLPGLVGAAGLLPPELFGLELPAALALPPAEYVATVYARLAQDALSRPRGSGCLVDYRDLPEATERVVAHFGATMSRGERERMLAAAGRNAKRPYEAFDPTQDANVTPEIRRAVQARAGGVYARLRAAAGAG